MIRACKATALALILSFFFAGRARAVTDKNSASTDAHPIATAQFGYFVLPEQKGTQVHSTLAFISDDALALLLCPSNLASNCQLVVLQLSGGHIEVLADKADVYSGTALFRSSEGLVLDPHLYGQPTRLYSRDLSTDEPVSRSGEHFPQNFPLRRHDCRLDEAFPVKTRQSLDNLSRPFIAFARRGEDQGRCGRSSGRGRRRISYARGRHDPDGDDGGQSGGFVPGETEEQGRNQR